MNITTAGHVTCALDASRMLLFGGRGEGGRYLSDTWVYDLSLDRWVSVDALLVNARRSGVVGKDDLHPPPRVFAACTVVKNNLYLFGGTDGVQNFCDLWVFRFNGEITEHAKPGHTISKWERAGPGELEQFTMLLTC